MSARGRHGARRLLLQALYQHQVGQQDAEQITAQFSTEPGLAQVDANYFTTMLADILSVREELDRRIVAAADRPLDQLDPVERGVLWIGLAELTRREDIPHRVAIDEAVSLAREFGAEGSHRYVNAILDSVAGAGR